MADIFVGLAGKATVSPTEAPVDEDGVDSLGSDDGTRTSSEIVDKSRSHVPVKSI